MLASRLTMIAILVLSMTTPGGVAAEHGVVAEHRVVAPPGTGLGLPFSPGILSDDFLFLSGAIGNQPGTVEVTGDAAAQTRQTMENLGAVLKAAKMDFSRVVEANVFLADSRHFQAMGKVYGEFLGEALPVRATVEADIAIAGALTEISLVAARPGVEVRRISPAGWPETGGAFSWGMLAGDTLFVAGMVSVDPATGHLVPGNVATQTSRPRPGSPSTA